MPTSKDIILLLLEWDLMALVVAGWFFFPKKLAGAGSLLSLCVLISWIWEDLELLKHS